MSSDQIEKVRIDFEKDTADHVMDVIRDDGLYRHLRFKAPDSTFYYYDLVTWPGYLAIVGDAGDYVFSRIRDMFEFFGSERGRINPDYWAQKLQAPRSEDAHAYSHDSFRAYMYSWADGVAGWDMDPYVAYPSLLQDALEREVLRVYTHHREEAQERLTDLADDLGDPSMFGDVWEWDMRELTRQFIWCCWAIARGIQQYQKLATEVATTTEETTA